MHITADLSSENANYLIHAKVVELYSELFLLAMRSANLLYVEGGRMPPVVPKTSCVSYPAQNYMHTNVAA